MNMAFNVFLILGLGILFLAIWIWALVDVLVSKRDTMEKLLWVIVIFLFNILGAIIYLFIGRQNRAKSKGTLKRDDKNRMIAGVCAGFANYFNVDVSVVRLMWILLTLFTGGFMILLYIAAAIIMPSDSGSKIGWWLLIALILIVILSFGLFIGMMSISHSNYGEAHTVIERHEQYPPLGEIRQVVQEVRDENDSVLS